MLRPVPPRCIRGMSLDTCRIPVSRRGTAAFLVRSSHVERASRDQKRAASICTWTVICNRERARLHVCNQHYVSASRRVAKFFDCRAKILFSLSPSLFHSPFHPLASSRPSFGETSITRVTARRATTAFGANFQRRFQRSFLYEKITISSADKNVMSNTRVARRS